MIPGGRVDQSRPMPMRPKHRERSTAVFGAGVGGGAVASSVNLWGSMEGVQQGSQIQDRLL